MHGFDSQHRHLVVKATKLHLIHRDDAPTHHPLTTVCSSMCLASPCLNTEHKAGHTVKTMPLNTQWMPFNCSVVFCRLPPLFCAGLCVITVSSVVSQSIYTYLNQCPLVFNVKKSCVSVGVDVEIGSPSSPAENDTWKRARVKISSCRDVAVFTTARESRSALRLWTQGSVGGF